MDDLAWESVRVVLAFLTRTSALVVLILLYLRFRGAQGPLTRAFRQAFGSLCFLLLWVWIASVAELVRYIQGAASAIELGANYIFIPNLVITIWLARLLWVFRGPDDDEHEGRESGHGQ